MFTHQQTEQLIPPLPILQSPLHIPMVELKEQVTGLYAQKLAESGFITIACDAAFQGASGGEPHFTDIPQYRIEDIRRMADFISSFPGIDPDRVGSFGICGGRGYTLGAAQSDPTIKAVATLSMFNTGRVRRLGLADNDRENLGKRMEEGNQARKEQEETGRVTLIGGMPEDLSDEQMNAYFKQLETQSHSLYRDGTFYYGRDYFHPRATGQYTAASLPYLMAWDTEDRMDMIAQSLLMMAGSEADTLYMTQDAFSKATGTKDKQLFLIDGASHIETYFVPEYVDAAMEQHTSFFDRTLKT